MSRAAVGAEGMSRAAVGAEGMSRAAVGAEGMSRAAVGAEGMSGDAGGAEASAYTLAVIDSGLGMPPADIEAANRRLAGAESFTIAPSKYLGHYVAGNLAARHGIGVRLDASPGNGITATVNIPPTLLTTEPVVGVPAVPPDEGRELPAAGRPIEPEPVGVAAAAGAGVVASAPESGAREAGDPWRSGEYQPGVTSSWPAPIGLSTGAPPPEPEPSRTQSGLVKRARANGTGPVDPEPAVGAGAPPAAQGAGPAGDLLAALRQHSANLQGVPGMAGQAPFPPPSARGPQPAPPADAPPLPPTHRPPPGAYDPTARHERMPGGEGRQRPAARGEPLTRRPDVGGGPAPQGPPTAVPQPGGPTGPAAGGPDAGLPLTRRVRGAQMPSTSPMSLRRTTGEHPAAPGGPAGQPPDRGRQPRQTRSADDVYSFLTNFTAGVQRGLDDSRPADRSTEDNGSG
jgi:hypothetical protein